VVEVQAAQEMVFLELLTQVVVAAVGLLVPLKQAAQAVPVS
jgi:hypothetical protein